MSIEKSEFENVAKGWIGVQIRDESRRTGFRGTPVRPGERIWLSVDEQVATANAPREEKDNPFVNGNLKLTASSQEMGNRRPIGDDGSATVAPEEPQETPETPPEAEGEGETPEEPPAADEAAQKETEMTEEQIADHNRKAAAQRAIPQAPPPSGSVSQTKQEAAEKRAAGEQKPPPTPEQVGTPEATAAAGNPPEGKRAAGEQVGTPDALKK